MIEHPAITRTLRTGYPGEIAPEPDVCAGVGCDRTFEPDDLAFEIDGEMYCVDCFKEWLADYASTNPEDIAAALNIEWRRIPDGKSLIL